MDDKYLNEEDLKKLNFAELALYIESLNELEEDSEEDGDING